MSLRPAICLALLVLGAACAAPEIDTPEQAAGPVVVEDFEPVPGLLRIGPEPERVIPLTEKGYTLLLPSDAEPAGLVVFLDGRKVDVSIHTAAGTFDHEALARSVGTLHLTTGNPLDFFFDDAILADVAERLQGILETNGLRETPLYVAGLSLGGTRALKLTIFLKQHADRFWAAPKAVAIVDAPLDMVRFWEAETRAARDAFHPAAADEGRWVTYLLETNLGGPPHEHFDRYVSYSPFVYTAPDGGNAALLREVAVRAYHEPDVNWWIQNRRKSYYSMNSIDHAALINVLRLQGNDRAELVTTHQARDGFDDGASPHTWSIVDNADLVTWLLAQN